MFKKEIIISLFKNTSNTVSLSLLGKLQEQKQMVCTRFWA